MLDAKEAREFKMYTTLNPEKLGALPIKTSRQPCLENLDGTVKAQTEKVLRKNYRLVRDAYRHYCAVSEGDGNTSGQGGLCFVGTLRMFQDCKLRSRDFCPHHLEELFRHVADTPASPNAKLALTPQGFVEVLVMCANRKFDQVLEQLADQVTFLFENHLKRYACHDTDSDFSRMAYDPKVRNVLQSHSKELSAIFTLYASADVSTTDAIQKVNTINIKEFMMFLQDCEFLDDTLTEKAVILVFEEIQKNASDSYCLDDVGLDDDDELALSEFLDGLVAITLYKIPDPFIAFHERVDHFLMELFKALRRHWSRHRNSPRVDTMLNMLQKKLR